MTHFAIFEKWDDRGGDVWYFCKKKLMKRRVYSISIFPIIQFNLHQTPMMISMYKVFGRTNVRLNLMMLLWAFVTITTMAQDITVSGKVQESNGSVLPGVSVLVKGTTRGTQTDADGNFKIAAPSSATLVFSFVGMTSQEVAINNRTQLSVTLQNDNKQLAEVVVIGYGTQRKKDLTGSIASITTADFNKGNIATPDQLVAGKVAGVQITPNGGAPGAGSTIRIRGGGFVECQQ